MFRFFIFPIDIFMYLTFFVNLFKSIKLVNACCFENVCTFITAIKMNPELLQLSANNNRV